MTLTVMRFLTPPTRSCVTRRVAVTRLCCMRARFPPPTTAHSPTARPDDSRCRRSDGGERSTPASRASRVAPLFQTETTESEFALNMSDIVRCQSPQVRFPSYFEATFCGFTSLSDNAADVIKKKYPHYIAQLGNIGGKWCWRFLWQREQTMSHIPQLQRS